MTASLLQKNWRKAKIIRNPLNFTSGMNAVISIEPDTFIFRIYSFLKKPKVYCHLQSRPYSNRKKCSKINTCILVHSNMRK